MAAISQQLLRDYRGLLSREQEAMTARRALRDRIMGMIESGATVEPGPLTCDVITHWARRLNRKVVVAAFGIQMYEALIAAVELTAQKSLRVTSSKCNHPPDAASRHVSPDVES